MSEGPLPSLPCGLMAVAGVVDAVSFLALGHVFVANMTGNVVLLGFAAAGAADLSFSASLVAIAAFMSGAFASAHIASRARQCIRMLVIGVGLEVALTTAGLVVALALLVASGVAVHRLRS